MFAADSDADANVSKDSLMADALAGGEALTFTAVPPGSGNRIALDRDEDGVLNANAAAVSKSSAFFSPLLLLLWMIRLRHSVKVRR